jgi:hypothetical protein
VRITCRAAGASIIATTAKGNELLAGTIPWLLPPAQPNLEAADHRDQEDAYRGPGPDRLLGQRLNSRSPSTFDQCQRGIAIAVTRGAKFLEKCGNAAEFRLISAVAGPLRTNVARAKSILRMGGLLGWLPYGFLSSHSITSSARTTFGGTPMPNARAVVPCSVLTGRKPPAFAFALPFGVGPPWQR